MAVLEEPIKHAEIDSVMLMGIHPGVLVQQSRPETVYIKAQELRALCSQYGDLDMVQCDGGVTFETIRTLKDSGISNFVCGSSTLYKGVDRLDSWECNVEKVKANYKNEGIDTVSYTVVIPSAGLGSRVGPYTKFLNKALITVGDKPVISRVIEKFQAPRLS